MLTVFVDNTDFLTVSIPSHTLDDGFITIVDHFFLPCSLCKQKQCKVIELRSCNVTDILCTASKRWSSHSRHLTLVCCAFRSRRSPKRYPNGLRAFCSSTGWPGPPVLWACRPSARLNRFSALSIDRHHLRRQCSPEWHSIRGNWFWYCLVWRSNMDDKEENETKIR